MLLRQILYIIVEVFSGVKSKSELNNEFDIFDLVGSTCDETAVLNIDDLTRVIFDLWGSKTVRERNTTESHVCFYSIISSGDNITSSK